MLFVTLFTVSFGVSTLLGGGAGELTEGGPPARPEATGSRFIESPPEGDAGSLEERAQAGISPVLPAVEPAAEAMPPVRQPLLALVVDDWGYGWEAADDFLALDVPLNIAVIPHLPFSVAHARRAAERGHEVIVHLPMEPLDSGWELGDGAVTTAMADAEIAREVRRAFDSIPFSTGMNNHMGSKATADERVVRAVLAVVKDKGAYFLDSRTTAGSLIGDIAREMGVPYLENDRFVDLDRDAAQVRERILLAADTAVRRGWAVAITHVHRAGYQGIVAALPLLQEKGVRLAHLSEVLRLAHAEVALSPALPTPGD